MVIEILNDICISEINTDGEMLVNVMGAETYLSKESVGILSMYFAQQETDVAEKTIDNTESISFPRDVKLEKCKQSDNCPATGKGHVGCYSSNGCFL